MAETSRVEITKTSKPLFLEFCQVHRLRPGDEYEDEAYVAWAASLTVPECIEIQKRHDRRPGFRLQ